LHSVPKISRQTKGSSCGHGPKKWSGGWAERSLCMQLEATHMWFCSIEGDIPWTRHCFDTFIMSQPVRCCHVKLGKRASGKRIYCNWCSGKWCILHCF
jgi:hypothetical protein